MNQPDMRSGALQDRTALVLGASRGIGAAIARACVAAGARVVLASRASAGLEQLAQELRAAGGRIRVVHTDVTATASVAAAVQTAVAEFGGLDAAFNNAGVQNPRTAFVDTTDEAFDRLLDVNLRGVFVAMKHELRAMLAGGRGGAIVNVASAAGQVGFPLIAPYVASKHGVIGLTRAAALEYASQGIRVNALVPGMVMTDMLRAGPLATPESAAIALARIPMGRIASAEEAAAAAVWLASAASSYVTGTALPVDGGYTAA